MKINRSLIPIATADKFIENITYPLIIIYDTNTNEDSIGLAIELMQFDII